MCRIVSLLALLLYGACLHAETDAPLQSVVQRLRAFGERIPQEKVYVHMDNTSYFLGDTIWFAAYTRQTGTSAPSGVSRILYADLYNHDGYLVERKLIEMKDGRGNGFFALDQPIMYSGFYELRAYTRWQLNWGVTEHKHSRVASEWFLTKALEREYYRDYEKLYSRVFPVYDKPADRKDPERNMTARIMRRRFKDNPENRKPLLTCYPEGGNLVAGVPCRVAFEAAWDDGEYMEGTFYCQEDSARTVHRGRGVMTVRPVAGRSVTCRFVAADGTVASCDLPKPQEEGVAVTLRADSAGWTAEWTSTPDRLAKEGLGMTVMNEGRVEMFKTLDAPQGSCRLEGADLRTGIHQLTVFDAQGRVYADRLFFYGWAEASSPTLRVAAPQQEQAPYSKVSLDVWSERADSGTISLAIRDGWGQESGYDNGNICTEMLLASEVRGFIPNPGWYFEEDTPARREALDLLLMTQGWRRFVWKDMALKGAWELTQPAEQMRIITGTVFSLDRERIRKDLWNIEHRNENSVVKKSEKERQEQELSKEDKKIRDKLADRRWDGEWLREKYNVGSNLKREVKVHAELMHLGSKDGVWGEDVTRQGQFRIQMPLFHGKCSFFLSAADTTMWKSKKNTHTWIQMMEDPDQPDDLPANNKRHFRTLSSDLFVRVSQPYPRFVKKYNHYQEEIMPLQDGGSSFLQPDTHDGTRRLGEVAVQAKRRRGLRRFDQSQPALLIDAYEARNMQDDSGMWFGPLARIFVGDYGLDWPFTGPNEEDMESRIYRVYGMGKIARAINDVEVPPDSVYSAKYLHVHGRGYDARRNIRDEDYSLFALDKYGIYTDYCPRLEGSPMYEGSRLPETRVAWFPYVDGSRRPVYRDRFYILDGFAEEAEFYHPDYSRGVPAEGQEDYRRTLYWNPNLKLDGKGHASVSFFTNARPDSWFTVEAAGQAGDGSLLWNKPE